MYRKFQTSSSPPKRSKTRAPFPPHHSGLPRKLDTSHPFGTRQPSSVIILPNGHIVSRACPVKLNASRGSKNYARFNSSEEKRRIIITSFATRSLLSKFEYMCMKIHYYYYKSISNSNVEILSVYFTVYFSPVTTVARE